MSRHDDAGKTLVTGHVNPKAGDAREPVDVTVIGSPTKEFVPGEKLRRRRRARGGVPLELDARPVLYALADFVRALEQMTPTAQRAAINWLTDRYLRGGKP